MIEDKCFQHKPAQDSNSQSSRNKKERERERNRKEWEEK